MKKLITSASLIALLASSSAMAQTTAPSTEMPSAKPSVTSPSTPAAPSVTSPSDTAPMNKSSSDTTTMSKDGMTLTEDQAKNWISKSVYSADNKNLGTVGEIKRDASGKVTELNANIGGFLGIGASHVRIMPNQFKLDGEKVVLTIPADQAKTLPQIEPAVTAPSTMPGTSPSTTRPAPKN
jgi:opacity protein-like surface antigen